MPILNVDDANGKMVHIKNSRRNDDYCKVYWNKTVGAVFTKKSTCPPVEALDTLLKYDEDFRTKDREVQIGDSVCYVFGIKHIPLFFCSITGIQIYEGETYVYLEPNSAKVPAPPTWKKFEPERFIFVSDNRLGTRNSIILDTEVYAVYHDELDIAEEIYAEHRVPPFLKSFLKDDSQPIGEAAFKKCHETLFKGIYSWAGKYRNEQLVVQNDRRPTLDKDSIITESKKFFNSLTRSQLRKIKDKETLIKMLIDTHKELAWIHPFQDGNGRAIRLFLELLSLTQGYRFNLEGFIETSRGKKSYYFAVRQSLKGQHKEIKALFEQATEKL
ncbi:Fic family protein [Aliivibrio sp. S10_S31]|uniref:Fic family protein n=1 Tax=Aliivibrio sp. S10_S31 TaxID=2720224 RepID=UPI001681844F|nr:Fic family protein [Aliivibrio sp. S10_S31]MBD1571533.1 Fic family protein [Aliivibrio sp. S10_S31]